MVQKSTNNKPKTNNEKNKIDQKLEVFDNLPLTLVSHPQVNPKD